jgi:hypothetical protein
VNPYIAFGVILRRLLYAMKLRDLGEDVKE